MVRRCKTVNGEMPCVGKTLAATMIDLFDNSETLATIQA